MRKVRRDELVDYQTYGDERPAVRARMIEVVKPPRRVHVGEHLTFVFENAETVRYQIQEMMRAERIVREADIRHELETYNALLGERGELGCCLLVEIEDEADRPAKLAAWKGLPDHLYVRCSDGAVVRATYDPAQVGDDRISSVQYLKFALGGRVPAAIGCDLPALTAETPLSQAQRDALVADLTD
jgi:hypothetical protein